METFLIRALQLILSLSILVFIHELGHFLFARLFKVRVDKFYMFFNPKRSIIRAKKINGKWDVKFFAKNVPDNERQKLDSLGDPVFDAKGYSVMEPIPLDELPDGDWRKYPESTEWGLGWLPLGGYCKIAGMIDESMDTTQMQQAPQPWEYRSKPTWQRLFIITGGVLMNVVLAMVIYSMMLFSLGREYLPLENAKYGLEYSQVMLDNGFRNGDKIISIGGQPVEQAADVVESLLIGGKTDVLVSRGGSEQLLQLPSDFSQQVLARGETQLISVRFPFVVEEVSGGSAAAKANLQKGDSVVGINNKHLYIYQDIAAELDANRDSLITLTFVRNGETVNSDIQLDETGKLGVAIRSYLSFMPTKRIEYGFFESIPAGISLGWDTLTGYAKQFKLVFTKEGSKQLSGFAGIGKMFAPKWDWVSFWNMTALLSIILAFMNILPIPALDGGHVLFLLYEMIFRRKPSEKFMQYAQTIGMLLLILLVLYANGNDIYKAIFK